MFNSGPGLFDLSDPVKFRTQVDAVDKALESIIQILEDEGRTSIDLRELLVCRIEMLKKAQALAQEAANHYAQQSKRRTS